jgi:hypothetical protein
MKLGAKRPLDLEDCYAVCPDDEAENLTHRLLKYGRES